MPCLDPDRALELVEGRLGAADAAAIEAHVAGCSDCRMLIAAVVRDDGTDLANAQTETRGTVTGAKPGPALLAPQLGLARGECVDRYVVVETHGRGGMGEVYKAYDPELDRTVALKMLRVGKVGSVPATEARARMIREARALAKLSHPNVVTVHDAGTFRDEVFITMEFVTGRTLRRWLYEATRRTGEIVDAFAAAGRGLAAAHAAGLVHRDFKPDNVVVSDDGRVRVLDFGLARTEADAVAPAIDVDLADEPGSAAGGSASGGGEAGSGSGAGSGSITRTGTVVGTPAYMAPEQRRAGPVDARADQFSFCVSLYEALYGERPVLDGAGAAAPPPEPSRAVPARLRRVVQRGLAPAAADRFASMDALLAALTANPGARRRRIAMVAVAAAAVVAVTGVVASRPAATAPCQGAQHQLDGVWDDAARARARRGVEAAAGAAAGETWSHVETFLDTYAEDWAAMHTDACEATRVRGDQSAAVLDLRMLCLDRRRRELSVFVELLANADAGLTRNAVAGAASLTPVADCGDVQALSAPTPLPADPDLRRRIALLQDGLARADGMRAGGRHRAAFGAANVVAAVAADIDYPPLRANALYVLALTEARLGKSAEAVKVQEDATYAALGARDQALAARGAIELTWVLGVDLGRADDARRWARIADAAITSLGGSVRFTALLQGALGATAVTEGKYDEALPYLERALALARQLHDNDDRIAGGLANLGMVYYEKGDYRRAADLMTEAMAIHRRVLGDHHPAVGETAKNLAGIYSELGELDTAAAYGQQAYDMASAAAGPESVGAAEALYGLASIHVQRGENDLAWGELQRVVTILERNLGPDNPEIAQVLASVGPLALARHDNAAALDAFRRALTIAEASGGPEGPLAIPAHWGLGEALAALGRRDEAMRESALALALFEKTLGPDHPKVAEALLSVGKRHLEAGRPAEALPLLERAARIFAAAPGKQDEPRARVDFAIARALWAHRERGRARTAAEKAAAGFAAAGPGGVGSKHEVDAWLASHPA